MNSLRPISLIQVPFSKKMINSHEGIISKLPIRTLIILCLVLPFDHYGVPMLLKPKLIPKTAPIQANRDAVCKKLNQGPTT